MGGVLIKRWVCSIMLAAFGLTSVMPSSYAQSALSLPPPGQMVALSPKFFPPVLKGLKVVANDPAQLGFIMDKGDGRLSADQKQDGAGRLIRYFLASLTVPKKDLWVNLSPYEHDRIIANEFGQTEMGRDLLAQDYVLKQLTSSLIYPEGDTGKEFWKKVYARSFAKYGTIDVPVDTFNKVWIMPQTAELFEQNIGVESGKNSAGAAVYVTRAHLKVMLESDYLARAENMSSLKLSPLSGGMSLESGDMAKDVLREVVLPVLEQEVNEGSRFARLRQVYYSLILAAWYKRKVKDSLLSEVYVDRNKVAGVNIADPQEKEKIWARYVEAFKKGAYNIIKEVRDELSGELIPRKYFSGGMDIDPAQILTFTSRDQLDLAMWAGQGDRFVRADVQLKIADQAQAGREIDSAQNTQLSDSEAVQRMAQGVSVMETEYRAVFAQQQENRMTGNAPIITSVQIQQAGRIYVRMIGLADYYLKNLAPDSRAHQIMALYRRHIEALHKAVGEADLMNRRVNWPLVYDRKDGRYKPVQSREYTRLREQTDSILAEWKRQITDSKSHPGEPQADPDGMYFQYLEPSGGLTRLSNRERIIQALERIETLSSRPQTGDVERERRVLSRDISRISTHSVNFLLRSLSDSFTRIMFYELIVPGGQWANRAEEIALAVMKREWPTLKKDLGSGEGEQRAPEILDAWLHNRDFWIKDDITRVLMASPEIHFLIAQTVGSQVRDTVPGADKLISRLSKGTDRLGAFGANKAVRVVAGAVALGVMGLAAYRMYEGEWPLLGRSLMPEVTIATHGTGNSVGGGSVSDTNEPVSVGEDTVKALLADLDSTVRSIQNTALPAESDQPTKKVDEQKIREAKEKLASAVSAADTARKKDEQIFGGLAQQADKFPVVGDKPAKVPDIKKDWHKSSAISSVESEGSKKSSVSRKAEAKHQFSVDIQGHTGGWVATIEGNVPPYLAEQSFHSIDPLLGQTRSVPEDVVEWRVGMETSQAWVVTLVQGNAGRELVPVPPGYVIGSVETEFPVKSVTVYYDRSNHIWYLDVQGSPGMVRIGVYLKEQDIPSVQIIGKDGQVLERPAAEQLIKDRIPAEIWQLVQGSRGLPVQERQRVKANILKLFFYTQNPMLQKEFEQGGDYLKTLFTFWAGDCDVLASANMIISYLLNLPAELQVGYLGSGQDFFTHKAHGWVLTPNGIEDSTGPSSAFVDRENVPDTLYEQELEYQGKRSQAFLERAVSVITVEQAIRLMGQKVQNLPEQTRDSQISSAALVTGVEGRHYSGLLKQAKRMRDEVQGQVTNSREAEQVLRLSAAFDFMSAPVKDVYQLMSTAHMHLGIATDIGHKFPELSTTAAAVKSAIFERTIEKAKLHGWELLEPLGAPLGLSEFDNIYYLNKMNRSGVRANYYLDANDSGIYVDVWTGREFSLNIAVDGYNFHNLFLLTVDENVFVFQRNGVRVGEFVKGSNYHFIKGINFPNNEWAVAQERLDKVSGRAFLEIYGPWSQRLGLTGKRYDDIKKIVVSPDRWMLWFNQEGKTFYVGPLADFFKYTSPEVLQENIKEVTILPNGEWLVTDDSGRSHGTLLPDQWGDSGGNVTVMAVAGNKAVLKERVVLNNGAFLGERLSGNKHMSPEEFADIKYDTGSGITTLFEEVREVKFMPDGSLVADVIYNQPEGGKQMFLGSGAIRYGLEGAYPFRSSLYIMPDGSPIAWHENDDNTSEIMGTWAKNKGLAGIRLAKNPIVGTDGGLHWAIKLTKENGDIQFAHDPWPLDLVTEFSKSSYFTIGNSFWLASENDSRIVVVADLVAFNDRMLGLYDFVPDGAVIPEGHFDLQWAHIEILGRQDRTDEMLAQILQVAKRMRLSNEFDFYDAVKTADVIGSYAPEIVQRCSVEQFRELLDFLVFMRNDRAVIELITALPDEKFRDYVLFSGSMFSAIIDSVDGFWDVLRQRHGISSGQEMYVSILKIIHIYKQLSNNQVSKLNILLAQHGGEKQKAYQKDFQVLEDWIIRNTVPVTKTSPENLDDVLNFLKAQSGLSDMPFDVEFSSETRSDPIFSVLGLLRLNAAFLKVSPDVSGDFQHRFERWQTINNELNSIMGETSVANLGFADAVNSFFSETGHDALALALMIQYMLLIGSALSRRIAGWDDLVLGKGAQAVVDQIWEDNPWFRGESAGARYFLDQLLQTRRPMDVSTRDQLAILRGGLTLEQRAVFDAISAVAYDVPDRKLVDARESLNWIPWAGMFFMFRRGALAQWEAMNSRILDLVRTLGSGTLDVKGFNEQLKGILQEYASQDQPVEVDTSISSIPDEHAVEHALKQEAQLKIAVPPSTTRRRRPDGPYAIRPYQPDDKMSQVVWRRIGPDPTAPLMVRATESEPDAVPVTLLVNVAGLLNAENPEQWLREVIRTAKMPFAEQRSVQKGADYVLDRLVFAMPDGTLDMRNIDRRRKNGYSRLASWLVEEVRARLQMGAHMAARQRQDMRREFYADLQNEIYTDRISLGLEGPQDLVRQWPAFARDLPTDGEIVCVGFEENRIRELIGKRGQPWRRYLIWQDTRAVPVQRLAAVSSAGNTDGSTGLADAAASTDRTGGIDLNPIDQTLKVGSSGSAFHFHIDPAQLEQWRAAPGIAPVIINIQEDVNVPVFLGISG